MRGYYGGNETLMIITWIRIKNEVHFQGVVPYSTARLQTHFIISVDGKPINGCRSHCTGCEKNRSWNAIAVAIKRL